MLQNAVNSVTFAIAAIPRSKHTYTQQLYESSTVAAPQHCDMTAMICRTGWSALYDNSSDEDSSHEGLHAEESQASSLSFQPHNLFEEHFAAAPPPSSTSAPADDSLSLHASGSKLSSSKLSSSREGMQSSTSMQQQENRRTVSWEKQGIGSSETQDSAGVTQRDQGAASPCTRGTYTKKTRRPWEHNSGSAQLGVVGEQHGDDPASALGATGQSPTGKPPLPAGHRPSAKGMDA